MTETQDADVCEDCLTEAIKTRLVRLRLFSVNAVVVEQIPGADSKVGELGGNEFCQSCHQHASFYRISDGWKEGPPLFKGKVSRT